MFNNKEEHATYDLKSLEQEVVCEDGCGDIVTVMIELGGVAIQKNTQLTNRAFHVSMTQIVFPFTKLKC
jgi:hypothetical protein